MSKRENCIVEGCPNEAHAKGYCRKHYGRLWRGQALEPSKPKPDEKTVPLDLRGAERELERMRDIYDKVIGLENRLRWARKIREQEELLSREKEARAERATAVKQAAVAAAG